MKISPTLSVVNSMIYVSPLFIILAIHPEEYLVVTVLFSWWLAAVSCTFAVLYFEKIFCCCCSCWNSAEEYIGVYDPENPDKEFKLENGCLWPVENKYEDEEEPGPANIRLQESILPFHNEVNVNEEENITAIEHGTD